MMAMDEDDDDLTLSLRASAPSRLPAEHTIPTQAIMVSAAAQSSISPPPSNSNDDSLTGEEESPQTKPNSGPPAQQQPLQQQPTTSASRKHYTSWSQDAVSGHNKSSIAVLVDWIVEGDNARRWLRESTATEQPPQQQESSSSSTSSSQLQYHSKEALCFEIRARLASVGIVNRRNVDIRSKIYELQGLYARARHFFERLETETSEEAKAPLKKQVDKFKHFHQLHPVWKQYIPAESGDADSLPDSQSQARKRKRKPIDNSEEEDGPTIPPPLPPTVPTASKSAQLSRKAKPVSTPTSTSKKAAVSSRNASKSITNGGVSNPAVVTPSATATSTTTSSRQSTKKRSTQKDSSSSKPQPNGALPPSTIEDSLSPSPSHSLASRISLAGMDLATSTNNSPTTSSRLRPRKSSHSRLIDGMDVIPPDSNQVENTNGAVVLVQNHLQQQLQQQQQQQLQLQQQEPPTIASNRSSLRPSPDPNPHPPQQQQQDDLHRAQIEQRAAVALLQRALEEQQKALEEMRLALAERARAAEERRLLEEERRLLAAERDRFRTDLEMLEARQRQLDAKEVERRAEARVLFVKGILALGYTKEEALAEAKRLGL